MTREQEVQWIATLLGCDPDDPDDYPIETIKRLQSVYFHEGKEKLLREIHKLMCR